MSQKRSITEASTGKDGRDNGSLTMNVYYCTRFMKPWFEILNDEYDRIYVLSVESATARREKFAQRFLGLNYEFYYGADKSLFTIKQVEKDHVY